MTERSAAPEPTGHPAVDAALARLTQIEGGDPAEAVAGYEEVHRRLAEVLADAADDPGPAGP